MSVEAGYFESAWKIWADRAEAKKKGAIAWQPGLSTWELLQKALTNTWKPTDVLALETDRHIGTVRRALDNHRKQVNWRRVSRGQYEWRSREVGPGREVCQP